MGPTIKFKPSPRNQPRSKFLPPNFLLFLVALAPRTPPSPPPPSSSPLPPPTAAPPPSPPSPSSPSPPTAAPPPSPPPTAADILPRISPKSEVIALSAANLLLQPSLPSPFSQTLIPNSSTLSPSDPSTILTSKQKSLAALSLLKQIPSSSSSAASADPSLVLSIFSAASLSLATHLDPSALSLAVSLLSPHSPYSIRHLISHLLLFSLSPPPSCPTPSSSSGPTPPPNPSNSLLLAAILVGDHPAAARFFTNLLDSRHPAAARFFREQ